MYERVLLAWKTYTCLKTNVGLKSNFYLHKNHNFFNKKTYIFFKRRHLGLQHYKNVKTANQKLKKNLHSHNLCQHIIFLKNKSTAYQNIKTGDNTINSLSPSQKLSYAMNVYDRIESCDCLQTLLNIIGAQLERG